MALTQVQGGMILPSTTLTTPIVATTMGVGGATPSTSGSGITFPATQSASSNANTLDDYEEGTYTATLTPSTSGSITLDAGSRTLSYTKIGNRVYVTGYVYVASVSSPSGANVKVSLPFTALSGSDAYQTCSSICANNLGSSKPGNGVWSYLPVGADWFTMYDGTINSVGTGNFGVIVVSNCDFRFSISYIAA